MAPGHTLHHHLHRDVHIAGIPDHPQSSGQNQSLASNATATSQYTRGLTGVNTAGNFFFINALVVFLFVLCAITLVMRLWKMFANHLRHLFAAGPGRDRQIYFQHDQSSIWPWIKRYLLYAPLWKNRHNREFRMPWLSQVTPVGTLPSRFHFTLLFVYVCSNLAYCSILDYSQPKAALLAELRGRSGALAVINLIPTIFFALRNNPLIPLLQVSYDTFNLFHRYAARIVVLESTVHVVAWSVNAIDTEGTASLNAVLHSAFLGWGTIAAAVFIAMALFSWGFVRHAFYETFLNTHRLMAIFAIAGVYVHLDVDDLPQLPYVKIGIALWVLEWLMRMGRIIYYNFSRRRMTQVTVEALPSEAVRLTFDLARPWTFRPGCHCHIYLPSISLWSSHPFSVAWSRSRAVGTGLEKLVMNEIELDESNSSQTSVSFIVRARQGMSQKLLKKAEASPSRTLTLRGAIEGPYGGHESLDSFGTVLLFAGGVGITHQISYIKHLIEGCEQGTVATKKIVLIWSVPNTEALEWVRPWMDEILRMKGRRDILTIRLFITKPKSQQEVISGTGTVTMIPGRCNPQTVLDKEFVNRVGAMVVTVCGPGAFADSVRCAVRRRVQLGSIDFIEEAFTY